MKYLAVLVVCVIAGIFIGIYTTNGGVVPLWFPHIWEAGLHGKYCYRKENVPTTVKYRQAYSSITKCLEAHHSV